MKFAGESSKKEKLVARILGAIVKLGEFISVRDGKTAPNICAR